MNLLVSQLWPVDLTFCSLGLCMNEVLRERKVTSNLQLCVGAQLVDMEISNMGIKKHINLHSLTVFCKDIFVRVNRVVLTL